MQPQTTFSDEKQTPDTAKSFPCFVTGGAELELISSGTSLADKYKINARNALRYLTYGKKPQKNHLLQWKSLIGLLVSKDTALLDAIREEMHHIFQAATNIVVTLNTLDPSEQDRLEIFINHLLAAYPFMDPKKGEKVILPQKILGGWESVTYHFDPIDISPQSGLLSTLLEDKDRLYAYGLIPEKSDASPYLLLMGTTYPTGQGAALNYLYNFKPQTSVGEAHDNSLLKTWLEQNPKAKVVGHSKGGTMAMILAARYPNLIEEAHCLNPTALSSHTVNRIQKKNNSFNDKIHVYTQAGDPIFLLGNYLLNDIKLFLIWVVD